jgi:hypothetical protein
MSNNLKPFPAFHSKLVSSTRFFKAAPRASAGRFGSARKNQLELHKAFHCNRG